MHTKDKIGKYEILEEIGRGSMGIVYKGRDPFINRLVAIKIIKKDLLDPAQSKEALLGRLKQEAQAAGNLSHTNIVVIYDYGEDAETAYIIMSYVEGKNLNSFFENFEGVDVKRIVEIMSDILDALSHAHEKNVIHRDIKPANIILTPEGRIRITDFGIARIESSELTLFGTAIGTPNYMAPEQHRGEKIDRRADLFSAGVILYQLLTGEKPFDGSSYASILNKILHVDPIPPSNLNPIITEEFDQIIKRCLAKLPDDRFQTAKEFQYALENALSTWTEKFADLEFAEKSALYKNRQDETQIIKQKHQLLSDARSLLHDKLKSENSTKEQTVVLERLSNDAKIESTDKSAVIIPVERPPENFARSKNNKKLLLSSLLSRDKKRLLGVSFITLSICISIAGYWYWPKNEARLNSKEPPEHNMPAVNNGKIDEQADKVVIKQSDKDASPPHPVERKSSEPVVSAEQVFFQEIQNRKADPNKGNNSAPDDTPKQALSKDEPPNPPDSSISKAKAVNSSSATALKSLAIDQKKESIKPVDTESNKKTSPISSVNKMPFAADRKIPTNANCASLTESFQLGDPSVTARHLRQACK